MFHSHAGLHRLRGEEPVGFVVPQQGAGAGLQPEIIELVRQRLGAFVGLRRIMLMEDLPRSGELFQTYVEEVLAPTVHEGDVVVLDNLGSHKGKAARAAIRAQGAHMLLLRPYSPDLNPIEQVFAKLKHLIRKAQPRNVEATWRKVGDLLHLFKPQECTNYLVNAGYGST